MKSVHTQLLGWARVGRWGFFSGFFTILNLWGGFIWLGVHRVLVGSRIGWWRYILELWLKRYRGVWHTSGSFWAWVHSRWLVQRCCGWLWWHIWWVALRAHWVLYKTNCQYTHTKEATYSYHGTNSAQNYSQGTATDTWSWGCGGRCTATDTWSWGCGGRCICRDNNMINWKLPGEEAAWHHVHMHGTHIVHIPTQRIKLDNLQPQPLSSLPSEHCLILSHTW